MQMQIKQDTNCLIGPGIQGQLMQFAGFIGGGCGRWLKLSAWRRKLLAPGTVDHMRSWETHCTSLASVSVCGLGKKKKITCRLTSLSQCYHIQEMLQGRGTLLLNRVKTWVRVHVCVHRYLQVDVCCG